jgi:hypothetical protein
MSHFKTLLTIIIVATFASACGAEPPPPTMAAADVQNTAVAGAFTIVAQTQAALPTATPLPPTETPTQTPLPTNTALALPQTQVATLTPVAAANTAGGDPCLTRVLSGSPKGRETIIRIVNTTKAAVTVSLYLNETPDHFECGYRSYNLSSRNDVVITDLVQGCYNLWAFNNDPKTPVNASGFGCINNPDKWTFEISQGSIKFVGP